jgi:hypothetical protein
LSSRKSRRKGADITTPVFTGATLAEVGPLLDEHHYIGKRCANPIHVFAWRRPGGLLGDTGRPVAATVFASPVNKYFGAGALEISRLVRGDEPVPPLSGLISLSIRWLRRHTAWKYCLAYADTGAGHHGGIYQAASFAYVRDSAGHSTWHNPATGETCSSRAFDQRRAQYREGWERLPGTRKYLYVRGINEKKTGLLGRFGWLELPYPKPEMEMT